MKGSIKMEECKIKNLYNLNETIAAKIFEGVTYPWEVLPKIENFIIELGNTLSKDEYDKVGDNVLFGFPFMDNFLFIVFLISYIIIFIFII